MKMQAVVPVVIFALLGVFYTLLPHDIHVSSGLGFGLDHSMHIALGVVFFVIAGVSYWYFGKKK